MQIFLAGCCCTLRIKYGRVIWRMRFLKMLRSSLRRSEDFVNDKPLTAIPVKDKTTCKEVTRVLLPRPQLFA